MYDAEGIIQIIIYLLVISAIVYGVMLKIKISSVKVMLFGIALMVFSYFLIKEMDQATPMIGFGICIAGFLKSDI